jgi:hypothetical protein
MLIVRATKQQRSILFMGASLLGNGVSRISMLSGKREFVLENVARRTEEI